MNSSRTWNSIQCHLCSHSIPSCGYTAGIEWPADNRGGGRKVHIRTSQPLPGKNMGFGTSHTWIQSLPPPGSATLGIWLNLSEPHISHLLHGIGISIHFSKFFPHIFSIAGCTRGAAVNKTRSQLSWSLSLIGETMTN